MYEHRDREGEEEEDGSGQSSGPRTPILNVRLVRGYGSTSFSQSRRGRARARVSEHLSGSGGSPSIVVMDGEEEGGLGELVGQNEGDDSVEVGNGGVNFRPQLVRGFLFLSGWVIGPTHFQAVPPLRIPGNTGAFDPTAFNIQDTGAIAISWGTTGS